MLSRPHLPAGHTGYHPPVLVLGTLRHGGTSSSLLATLKAQKPSLKHGHPEPHPHAPLPPHGTVPHGPAEGLKQNWPPRFCRTWAPFHLWRGASQRPHESQATPLSPKPLGRRLLQPFTHTNKNKSRCRPLNSAKASFPLAPRAARSCARGLGTLPADLALSLPAHPVSFSHRAARRAEWDVTAGTGVAGGCQEPAGYGPQGPRGQMPHTRVPPSPPPPPCPPAGGVGERHLHGLG